jgi:hypothetical protein
MLSADGQSGAPEIHQANSADSDATLLDPVFGAGPPTGSSPDRDGAYRPHLALATLAFNAEGETLWGFNTCIEDAIPSAEIGRVLQNGYRAVYDENNGQIESMEIRLPLPPDKQSTAQAQ